SGATIWAGWFQAPSVSHPHGSTKTGTIETSIYSVATGSRWEVSQSVRVNAATTRHFDLRVGR
ncbi:MAG TPA: hypothetical protein VFO87_07075, partial [Nitrospira sp.]|nr:hypothetical protein [Nitrospira sp.]